MKNSIIVLLILGTVSFSCSDSTSSDESEKISLPLKVGNSWTYNVIINNVQNNSTNSKTDITFTVVSDTVLNGARWFLIETENAPFNVLMGGYYSNQDNGIHYSYSLQESDFLKESSESFTINSQGFLSPFTVNEQPLYTELFPFLHHPDHLIPDRLIKTSRVIGSISYLKEDVDPNFDTNTQNYIRSYYQVTINGKEFALNPINLEYSVSNDLGFVIYEQAYFSSQGSTEDDPRLQLLSTIRFELTEFKSN